MLLLAGCEVEHLVFVFDQNGTLSFRLCDVKPAREDGDLGLLDSLDHACKRILITPREDAAL